MRAKWCEAEGALSHPSFDLTPLFGSVVVALGAGSAMSFDHRVQAAVLFAEACLRGNRQWLGRQQQLASPVSGSCLGL